MFLKVTPSMAVVLPCIRKQYSGFRLRIQGRKDADDETLNYGERLTLQGLMIWRAFINGLVTLSPFILIWAFLAHFLGIPHTTMRITAGVFVYVAVIFFVHPLVMREMMRMTYTGFWIRNPKPGRHVIDLWSDLVSRPTCCLTPDCRRNDPKAILWLQVTDTGKKRPRR